MTAVRLQESAEAVVLREASRGAGKRPINEDTGRTHNSGRAELGRRTRPSMVLTWSVEADRLSYQAASTVAEKSAASSRKNCQEPPYADPHVRWCGSGADWIPKLEVPTCQGMVAADDVSCKHTRVLVASGSTGDGESFLMSPGKRKSSGEMDLLAVNPLQPVIRVRTWVRTSNSTASDHFRLRRNVLFI